MCGDGASQQNLFSYLFIFKLTTFIILNSYLTHCAMCCYCPHCNPHCVYSSIVQFGLAGENTAITHSWAPTQQAQDRLIVVVFFWFLSTLAWFNCSDKVTRSQTDPTKWIKPNMMCIVGYGKKKSVDVSC